MATYYVHSRIHGTCGHEHSSYVTLAKCMLRRERHGCKDDRPIERRDGVSTPFLNPQRDCLHQTMEVVEYLLWLVDAKGSPLVRQKEVARVERQIEMMEKAGDGRLQDRCPLCGAFAKVTCSKACAYNRFHERPVHVPQSWWDMHRRNP